METKTPWTTKSILVVVLLFYNRCLDVYNTCIYLFEWFRPVFKLSVFVSAPR